MRQLGDTKVRRTAKLREAAREVRFVELLLKSKRELNFVIDVNLIDQGQ